MKNTISRVFASVWRYVTEFLPTERGLKATVKPLDSDPKTACSTLHMLSLYSLGSWVGKHSLETRGGSRAQTEPQEARTLTP